MQKSRHPVLQVLRVACIIFFNKRSIVCLNERIHDRTKVRCGKTNCATYMALWL